MRTTLLRLLLSGAASVALLAGCGGGDVSPNAGEVRLVNATDEFGALDLYESDNRLAPGVAPFAAGNYEDLNKGDYTFSVRGGVAGATIATLDAALEKNSHLTLVAYSNAGTPALAAIDEDEDEPDKGLAKLRFFNTASSDSGAIDAYLVRAADCTALTGAIAVATAVSDLQSTFIDINPSGAEPYRLCVTAAGDKTDVRLDTAFAVGDREIVTVILSRTPGAVLLNGAALVQEGVVTQVANASARVRLAVGFSAGSVTATYSTATSTTTLGTAVVAPSVGTYRLVPTGASLAVTLSSGGGVTLPATAISSGGDYTLLVADGVTAGTAVATLLPDDNARSTNSAKPVKMRLVHGATTGNPISLSVGTDAIDGVTRGTASTYVLTEASGATATKVEITDGLAVLCTGLTTLSATPTVYSVFALGALPTMPVGPCIIRTDR